jgi:hypothetical protein
MSSDRSWRLALVLAADWRSFQPGQQREFGFQREGPWVRKPDPWVPEEMRFENWEEERRNVYHVTTNLAGVKQTAGLRSRAQLGQGGTTGLGGGYKNEAGHLVSTTYSYQKAREIYDGLQYMCSIIRNEVPASQIMGGLLGGTFFDDLEDREIRNVLLKYISKKELRDENFDIDAALDSRITTPEAKYDFYIALEDAVMQAESESHAPRDYPSQRVGFTTDFGTMRNIKCDQIAILQLAVRKDAESEYVHEEQELRFDPDDLRVVRYYQP